MNEDFISSSMATGILDPGEPGGAGGVPGGGGGVALPSTVSMAAENVPSRRHQVTRAASGSGFVKTRKRDRERAYAARDRSCVLRSHISVQKIRSRRVRRGTLHFFLASYGQHLKMCVH